MRADDEELRRRYEHASDGEILDYLKDGSNAFTEVAWQLLSQEADRRSLSAKGPTPHPASEPTPPPAEPNLPLLSPSRWIEESLYRLAEAGWSTRRIVPNPDFILKPERLPRPKTVDDMATIVQRLYSHARTWAPGLEIPYYVPKVNVVPLVSAVGQYRADAHGYLFIEVAPEFIGQHSALLAILAHEACHHILDLSSIRGGTREHSEKLTDLASFICGFGELVLSGHSQVRRVDSGWKTIHLGYLTSEEYRLAQLWVLKVQSLLEETAKPVASGAVIARKGNGFLSQIKRWLGGRGNERLGSAGSGQTDQPGPLGPSLRFDATTQRRKVALARLGGDRSLLARLVEFERRRAPQADDLTLLDAVIESLERDRR